TATMAPEISPPGRFAQRNNKPPAAPMTSVSSALRILARLEMANAVDAGIWLTAPYGKSPHKGQMHHAHAAMHGWLRAPVSFRHVPLQLQPPEITSPCRPRPSCIRNGI